MTLGTVSRRERAPESDDGGASGADDLRQVSGLPEPTAVLLLAVTAGTASVARFRVPRASADPRCPTDRPGAARRTLQLGAGTFSGYEPQNRCVARGRD